MSNQFAKLVFALTAVFFALFFLWPIAETVRGAFVGSDGRFTLDYIAEVFRNPLYLEGLWNSFQIGIFSTLLAALIAMPLAWMSDRFNFPGKPLLGALVLVPMIMPPFVGAIGVKQILGQQGALNAFLADLGILNPDAPIDWLGEGRVWGVVALIALNLYPIIYLNVLAALANVDPAMEEAAENLGCTGLRKFFKITLPLIKAGVGVTAFFCFMFSWVELLLARVGANSRLIVEETRKLATYVQGDGAAAAAAVIGEAQVEELTDRIAAVFVPIILALSAATLAGWYMAAGNLETALVNAIAVLVIACPCALVLSTPAAIASGLAAGARRGLLVKGGAALEVIGRVSTVAFDKTGTLTRGPPELVRAQGGDEPLRLAASLEQDIVRDDV